VKNILDPIKAESLKDVFIARFEELILSGKLAIGQKLPSERELALQLGVSRPVVHEGLVDLAFKGLVSIKPRVGTVVNDYRREGSLALLTSLVNYHEGSVAPALLTGTIDVRRNIETATARLAAANRTAEHLAVLTDLLRREKEVDHGDAERISEIDFALHHAVAIATDNPVYPLLLNTFKQFYTNLTRLFFADSEVVPVVFAFHKKLVAAIERQSETGAVRVMGQLLDHGEAHVTASAGKMRRKR